MTREYLLRIFSIVWCFIIPIIPVNAQNGNDKSRPQEVVADRHLQECYETYLLGVEAEEKKDTVEALRYYDKFFVEGCHCGELGLIEMDLMARYIGISLARERWNDVCRVGRRLIKMRSEIQSCYPNTAWMYNMYVSALYTAGKWKDVESVVNIGQPYIEEFYKPTDGEYYDLRLYRVLAKMNKHDYESADSLLCEIKRINDSIGNHVVDELVEQTTRTLNLEKEDHPFKDRHGFVEEFSRNVVELSILTGGLGYGQTIDAWTALVAYANDFLGQAYFDKYSMADEGIWTKFILYYSILVNGFGRGLEIPDRGELAFNHVLMCKNFLDWHTQLINSSAKINWETIYGSLSEGEMAIEFIPMTNELVFLSREYETPQIVEIDKSLFDQILTFDSYDPIAVNDFYSQESPLCNLIKGVEPYFEGHKKIFISGSNVYAQINYGAIPYEGKTLGEFYEIVPMLSTADIMAYKQRNNPNNSYKSVILYGGIDYDTHVPAQTDFSEISPRWAYADAVPDNFRKGFNQLPYSKAEVDSIASLCEKYGFEHQVYTAEKADEESIKASYYPEHTILHFATHSFLLPSYSYDNLNKFAVKRQSSKMGAVLESTGLLLAGCNPTLKGECPNREDGILTAAEIGMMDFSNVDLVVLSACSTGLGDVGNLNGVIYGLASAFRTAGVGQVMISLWDVPDNVTSFFMTSFYDNLLNGSTPRESLRLAQSQLIEQGFSDPYYWGAFVILD